MHRPSSLFCGSLFAAFLIAAAAHPAGAVTMKECSAKYKAAKADGSASGMDWKSFRAAQCSSAKTAAAATPATAGASTAATTTTTPMAAAPMTAPTTAQMTAPASKKSTMAAAPASTGPATFPSAVDAKYSKETAGKARMHTCLDQYKANKASGGNGGMRWIQKGGGYYSECSKKLKAS